MLTENVWKTYKSNSMQTRPLSTYPSDDVEVIASDYFTHPVNVIEIYNFTLTQLIGFLWQWVMVKFAFCNGQQQHFNQIFNHYVTLMANTHHRRRRDAASAVCIGHYIFFINWYFSHINDTISSNLSIIPVDLFVCLSVKPL